MADLQNNPQQIVDDASKKLEADPLPPAEPETIVIAPHPKDDQPLAEKPGKPPKKKGNKGMLIGMLLFFILTLPVAIYYGSQKYTQITEQRGRASGEPCTQKSTTGKCGDFSCYTQTSASTCDTECCNWTGGSSGGGSSGGNNGCPNDSKLLNECFGGAAGNPGGCGGFGCGANEQRNMQCCYTNGCPTDEEAYICKGPGAKWETRGDCFFDPSCGSPAATNTPAPTNTTAPIATNTPVPTATNAPTATETPQATATPTERVIYVQQPAERVVYVQQPTSTRVIAQAPIATATQRPTPKVPVSGTFDVKAIVITVGSVLLLALGLIL